VRDRTESSLQELKAIELIYEQTLFPELVSMCKHALTQDVAYNSLLEQRRQELHRLMAQAIEDLYADRLAEHSEILACLPAWETSGLPVVRRPVPQSLPTSAWRSPPAPMRVRTSSKAGDSRARLRWRVAKRILATRRIQQSHADPRRVSGNRGALWHEIFLGFRTPSPG
jgi:hypothetical protein